MLAYFLGIGTATSWHYCKHKIRGERWRFNWTSLGFIVAVSAMVFIGLQNTQLATEVQNCQREFNSALVNRARIAEENDRLSQDQRYWLSKSDEAVGDLIARATSPIDPKIAAMAPDDPRRRAWESGLVMTYNIRTNKYRAEIQKIEDQQEELKIDRQNHPLPEITCGADTK
jgi:hypothetical protein